jgi:2-dehydro-3-deoxyglucarate aldolase/4-hydroxy-2-oxoheptanedioate aldolase
MSNTLQKNLRGTAGTIGTWLSIGSPVIAELAAGCGFDWLLFDFEHGCAAESSLIGNLQALNGSACAPIVRVGAPHPDLLARVLDWGAAGVMVPHVESAEAAEACVRALHYPPRGHRGFSRSVRAYGYGLRPPAPAEPPAPVFIAQIETLKGVRNAAAIAAVDGVDMLFVGPADLSFDINARAGAGAGAPDYDDCLKTIIAAAGAAGKATGILVRNIDDIRPLRALGFQHLAIDSDLAILRNRYKQLFSLAGVGAV